MGLDEQVQRQTDVLSIAAELNQLERSCCTVSFDRSLVSMARGKVRLDAVDIGWKQVAHHLYTFKELEAAKGAYSASMW
jgi:hypothetical protein